MFRFCLWHRPARFWCGVRINPWTYLKDMR